MAKLEHVGVAHHDLLVDALACLAVVKVCLAVGRQLGLVEVVSNLVLADTVEHRGRNLDAKLFASPAKVRFEHLPDVHARRHTQRVQDQVNRRSVLEERHVLLGDDLGHNTLVAVAPGHFVTHGQLALGGDEHAHRLDDAGVDLVPGRHTAGLFLVLGLEVIEALGEAPDDLENLVFDRRRINGDHVVNERQLAQQSLRDLAVGRDDHLVRLRVGDVQWNLFTEQYVAQVLGQLFVKVVQFLLVLIIKLLGLFLGLTVLGLGTLLVFLLGRNFDVHHLAIDTGRHLERGVLDISSFLTKDSTEQTFFRCQLGLALRRDFADQNIARFHLGTHTNHSVHVEVLQCLFTEVRDVAGDFLRAKLGVPCSHLVLGNVDGRVNVVLHDAFADTDGILKVVAVPRHVGDQHVAAKRNFAVLGAGAVCQHIALFDLVATIDERLLVDTRAGVGTMKLAQLINPAAFLGAVLDFAAAFRHLAILGDHDLVCSHGCHHTVHFREDNRVGVLGHLGLHAGGDER